MSDSYNLLVKCRNCKNQQWVKDIPASILISEHCAEVSERCSYCHCELYESGKFKREHQVEEKPEDEDDAD